MNFGKQFKRVRQQADQLFLRGDRTDVSSDLHSVEKCLEELKVLSEAYLRGLEKHLHIQQLNDEKRMKKVPEYLAADLLKEALCLPMKDDENNSSSSDLLREMLRMLIEVKQAIGVDVIHYEEEMIGLLGPIHSLLKEEYPQYLKQKKHLKQAALDVDAAKSKYRHSVNDTSNQKLELYKDELDEAESKFEQLKDAYAGDVYAAVSKERELTSIVYHQLQLEREHLTNALSRINRVLPEMERLLDASTLGPVFGISLHEHLRIIKQDIALPIKLCVQHLIQMGLYEEGLFRVPGSATKVRRFRLALEANLITPELLLTPAYEKEYDVHVISATLKSYLRELPEPLLTFVCYDRWLEAIRTRDHDEKLQQLWRVISELPGPNRKNLAYIIQFLAMLAKNKDVNKMSSANVAIVIAPNLIWSPKPNNQKDIDIMQMERDVAFGSEYQAIVEYLVEYCTYFFNDKIDFGVTPLNTKCASSWKPQDQSSGSGECESPKQPGRHKKKAPAPPSAVLGNDVQLQTSESDSDNKKCDIVPANKKTNGETRRIQHSSSLRRPKEEPPKPPGSVTAPVKPPRPSPPNTVNISQPILSNNCCNSVADQKNALTVVDELSKIGFEEFSPLRDRFEKDEQIKQMKTILVKSDSGVTLTKSDIREPDSINLNTSVEKLMKSDMPSDVDDSTCSFSALVNRGTINNLVIQDSDNSCEPSAIDHPVPAHRVTKELMTTLIEKSVCRQEKPVVPEKSKFLKEHVDLKEKPLIPERPVIKQRTVLNVKTEDDKASSGYSSDVPQSPSTLKPSTKL